jgi:hypothetical protein
MKEIRLKELELHSGLMLKEALGAILHTIVFIRSFNHTVEARTEEHIDIKHAIDPAMASSLDREISTLIASLDASLIPLGPHLGKTSVVLELSSRSVKKSWFLPNSSHSFERWVLPLIVNQQQPISAREEGLSNHSNRHMGSNLAATPAATAVAAVASGQGQAFEMGVGTLERLRVFTQERLSVLQCIASVIEIASEAREHLPVGNASASSPSSFSSSSNAGSSSAGTNSGLQLLVKLTSTNAGTSLSMSLSKLLHLPPGMGEF